MKKNIFNCMASVALISLFGAGTAGTAPFTGGNVVIYRVGSGTGSLANTGNPVFLDEYTPSGVLVQSIALPTTASGTQRQLIASGTSTSEGLLTRSTDGRFLVLAGYAANLGGAVNLTTSAAASIPRTVGRVAADSSIDTSTALTDFSDLASPRSVASADGSEFWVDGGAGGIRYAAALGSTTSIQLSTTVLNLRQTAIFGGQLYVSDASGTAVRLGAVGSALPVTSGQTIVNLPGFPLTGSPYGFFFADLSSSVAGMDTLYVADDGAAALTKYSLVGGSWVANGTVGADADDYRGITGAQSGTTVTLYLTRKGGSSATGGGELVSLVDSSGYNAPFAGAPTLLATATANTAFRGVAFIPVAPPTLACPPNMTVPATSAAGAVVGYPPPTPSGGCPPVSVACNPPSGSTFPVGTTTVTCVANSPCGTANCSFTVTVTPPAAPERFFGSNVLPPPDGMYITPQLYHQLYANGIIISNISHRRFTQSEPPPPPGTPPQTHNFGSQVQMMVSMDHGATFTPVSAPAQVTVQVSPSTGMAPAAIGTQTFDTEMLALNIAGGGLPPGVMVRESPSKQSLGKTTVRAVEGGYMIGSFFDIFTEISVDNGANWVPADQAAHVELRGDPVAAPSVPAPSRLLPPPNDLYVSPALYHLLLANGIVIKDIKHRFFTQSLPPPEPGTSRLHHFDSQVDMQVSKDGGNTFSFVRAPAAVDVGVAHRSSFDGIDVYDTEMLALNIQGGDLPPGMMLRESPTRRSEGGTAIEPVAADGTRRIHSFFDIWPEVSTDGGATWTPAPQAARVNLACNAPEIPKPSPNLPPPDGQYVSPQQYHALYAMGIVIKDIKHNRFTQSVPPPPPGGTQIHEFNSQVQFQVSMDGGATFSPHSAPAHVMVRVDSSTDAGDTRYFNTEMLALDISGGSLPAGVMVRESPSRASLGRTSIRMVNDPATGIWDYISSFFDIFTEISLDGGATWSPQTSEPAEVALAQPQPQCVIAIRCPADITVNATGPAGAVVNYPVPTVVGNCGPFTVVCNPPSGSTFPIGTTTVTCTAKDSQGNTASCSFKVTVRRPKPGFFPNPLLPPPNGVYITPRLYHQLYQNGIIIRDIRHRRFTQGQPPPPPGGTQIHQFGSVVELEHSMDGGATFQKVSAPANCTVRVSSVSSTGGLAAASIGTQTFDTEMLALDISGGSLPAGVMIRESPTLASTGQTTVRQVGGGYLIDSFFDIFTEISLDGGANWSPAQEAAEVELRPDVALVAPIPAATRLLPPPNDVYISPAQFHILTAQGIVIKDVRHSFFTHSMLPPPPGTSQIHQFDSQVDMMVSQDGGNTFRPVRAPAAVAVEVEAVGSADSGLYDTEMLALDIRGGDLPPGVMIRESPTLPSRGQTQITPQADGTQRIGSFFDIFPEVSLDGGATWMPAQSPAHVELICQAPENFYAQSVLPPPNGACVSTDRVHAVYASGIVIRRVRYGSFAPSQPPPAPGASQIQTFHGQVDMEVSMDGGNTFAPVSAPVSLSASVRSSMDEGNTRFFDTEMLSLNIEGGNLPPGVMVRESPSHASLGRVSERMLSSGGFMISGFFDIFTELTVDGGQMWQVPVNGPALVVLQAAPCLAIGCPPDMTVATRNAAGAVVNYPAPTVLNLCGNPVTVTCAPPSGSVFPIGMTVVTCTAKDTQGNTISCSFKVTVVRLAPPQPVWFPNPLLPPPHGEYITPRRWHQLYANGIIISNVTHRRFLQSFPPPAPGTSETHSFGSEVAGEVSMDGGMTFMPFAGNADVSVRVTISPGPAQNPATYDTEMLALNLTVPGGIMIRESPTLASTGQTMVQSLPGGGYAIASFFDVNTELSMDGGANWSPAQAAAPVELHADAEQVTPIVAPTRLLPPPIDLYVSPQLYHILLQNGIVIRNVRHKLFTRSLLPPEPGIMATHNFGSQVDLELSQDGGMTFRPMRAPADVTVGIQHRMNDGATQVYDTEMLALDIRGGDLPTGIMIRESPTLASQGGTALSATPDGQVRIGSFFDIFVEVSTDGGANWTPAQGPAHMELICDAPPIPLPDPNLPPLDGQYISPQQWHALYAQGIIISNVIHRRFTQTFPPPPPGVTETHSFGSQVECDLSMNNGQSWQHVMLPAQVTVSLREQESSGNTRYFETEMLSLNLTGPNGIMIRESPTKASLGRTSIRMVSPLPPIWDYVSSFFDVFTELSTDGGNTWQPSSTGPGTVRLVANPATPLTITCPPDKTLTASGPAGAVVNYPPPTVSGGCPPYTVVCNPPSGSTFPVGTTTVTCTAGDACNGSATCTFQVTVKPPVGDPCLEPDSGSGTVTLPPVDCQYLSPDQVHMIIDGLPPGTTIQLAAIHKNFICREGQQHCTNDCFTTDDCNPTNGATEAFMSVLQLHLHGTGMLAGWDRDLVIPNVQCQSQVGPRNPGAPTQSFDTDMQGIQGQIIGDPDFDLLRVTAGTGFGMPSPGHTTLTRQAGGTWAVDSFFDITYRIDFVGHAGGHVGGMSGSTTGTIRMVAVRATPCVSITCPTNITVWTCNANGAVVNYTVSATNACGGTVSVNCTPPSGSTFPIGTSPVNCTATGFNAAGVVTGTATCSFTVTVIRDTKAPQLTCPNDIVTRTCADREIVFYNVSVSDDCDPAPRLVCNPPSGSVFPTGTTVVNCVATDACGNKTNCTFHVVIVPEPLPKMTITIVPGAAGPQLRICWTTPCPGYRLQCTRGLEPPILWEDVTNAVTVNNGTNCVTLPLQTNRRFYRLIRNTPQEVFSSTDTLPPVGAYSSPAGELLVFPPVPGALPQGLQARWFIHRIPPQPCLTCPQPPCLTCPDLEQTFDTTLEVQYSTDGGRTFLDGRGSGPTTVHVHPTAQNDSTRFFDIEIIAMSISGGTLPPGVMIRESPSKASTGRHIIRPVDGGYRIGSFFDVFIEVSLDGGQNWLPAPVPVHLDYGSPVPENTSSTDTFPPSGSYDSPAGVLARYGNGIILRRLLHRIQDPPPPRPPPCLTCPPDIYGLATVLSFEYSADGGQTFQPGTAIGSTSVSVRHACDTADTRLFETEMLSMSLNGVGPLATARLRESPTLASTGKTSIQKLTSGGYRIGSFFDVFTELSLDGGQTWSPVGDPTRVELHGTQ